MLVKHTGTDEVVRNKVVGNDFRFKDSTEVLTNQIHAAND